MKVFKTAWTAALVAAGVSASGATPPVLYSETQGAMFDGPPMASPSDLSAMDAAACCEPACDDACSDSCCDTCGVGCNGWLPCSGGEATPVLQNLLFGDNCDPLFTIGGWTQIGYHTEQTPLSGQFGDVLAFNDVPDQVNLHQQWLFVERVADGSNGLDIGGRVDVMYGTDAQKTQAFGNDPGQFDFANGFDHGVYGWALPQLYAEVAYHDWSVIAGHFYTLVGYEVVTAPDNFFYSHALTMFNSEPFTHTGVLATYSGLENAEIYGGWTLGWDTGFDQSNGGSSFLGGFSTNLTDSVAFTYIATAGNFGARSGSADGYSHSLVFDVALSDKLNYVLQSDYVGINNPAVGANDQVGINQYLFYTLSDCVAFGGRFEWWKSDGQSFQEFTLGMNYRPLPNVVIRPEVRYDWTETANGLPPVASNLGTFQRDEETTFGVDMVLTY